MYSNHLNSKLRDGHKLTSNETIMMNNLDEALAKLPPYKGTVYRSVDDKMIIDEQNFGRLHQVGNMVTYPAYTSASLDIYDEAFKYQFIISSKNAKNMIDYNAAEKEILFPRNSTFLVVKKENNTFWLEEVY